MANTFTTSSGTNSIDALLEGARWDTNTSGKATITYSFPEGSAFWASNYGQGEVSSGWSGIGTENHIAFELALALWADVANINFVKVADGETYGDIRVAYSNAVSAGTAGWAYTPNSGSYFPGSTTLTPSDTAGDIWINPTVTDFSVGSHGFSTLLHEIGHALGLKHPFQDDPTLPTSEDTTGHTLMSYTETTGAGYNVNWTGSFSYSYSQKETLTPMLYDIQAIQYLYGANTETRNDNTTYSFSTDAELKAIWDGGGIDTFDLSQNTQNYGVVLDLREGAFSSIGAAIMNPAASATDTSRGTDNIAIAYGTTIENAIGTSLADQITGNESNNEITGGSGDDTLDGMGGEDTAIFSGTFDSYQITENSDGSLTVIGQDGTDQLSNIEILRFSDKEGTIASLNSTTNGTETNSIGTGTINQTPITPDSDGVENAIIVLGSNSTPWLVPHNEFLKVFGNDATNSIRIELGGSASLYSFNNSNNIYLQGNSDQYQVSRSGATIQLKDSLGATVNLSASVQAQTLFFADGQSDLIIDSSVKLGGTILSTEFSAVTIDKTKSNSVGWFNPTEIPWESNSGAATRLVMTANANSISIPEKENAIIYGSDGSDHLSISAGSSASIFNLLNQNQIDLSGATNQFSVHHQGATVIFKQGTNEVSLPASINAQNIQFSDQLLSLKIDQGGIYLGDQLLTTDPSAINPISPSANLADQLWYV